MQAMRRDELLNSRQKRLRVESEQAVCHVQATVGCALASLGAIPLDQARPALHPFGETCCA